MLRDQLHTIQANISEMIYKVFLKIWIEDTLKLLETVFGEQFHHTCSDFKSKSLICLTIPTLRFYRIKAFIYPYFYNSLCLYM